MDKIESQVMPVPPNIIGALRAGFDAVANKIAIILIPFTLDLLLWWGPHLQVKTILNSYIDAFSSAAASTQTSEDILPKIVDTLRSAAAQFNVISLVRTYPVGIPSLMASRQPTTIPLGSPASVDITNPLVILGIAVVLMFIGLLAGSFYYLLVSNISINGRADLSRSFKQWSWTAAQVVSLSFALLVLLIVISIPAICIILAIAQFGISLSQFGFFIYTCLLIWLAFPLIFSTHGIFVNHLGALASVQRSMVMTRMTMPTTALFILFVFVISEGMDFLWRVPAENSWLSLLGVAGHAFITSALLAASFIYYRDADLWTQGTLRVLKSQGGLSVRGG